LEEGVDPGQSGEDGELAAGNGVAMRIAPLGLLDCLDLEKLREDVRETGNITHRNREAIAGAQAVAYAIARGVRGDLEPETLIADAVGFIGPCLVADRLGQASRFLASEMDSAEALARLGTGGYVVETVASAFFCFLSSPDDFEEAVSLAVAGGLDTDTMGAITGAISGACNGLEGVPERWRERVESYRDIVTMADGIYDIVLHGSQSK
jgi:ADP-ribosylglycohydrolase